MKKTNRLLSLSLFIVWILFVAGQLYLVYIYFGDGLFDRYIYRKVSLFGYGKIGSTCTAQTNSFGYREREFYPKREGEYLILVIGDSNVYGLGLLKYQRYSNILENKLNKIRPTRVFNLGKCGTNIFDNYRTLQRFREKLNPDLIIIGITENDLLVSSSLQGFPRAFITTKDNLYFHTTNEPEKYTSQVLGSFTEDSANMAMFNFVLSKFPKDKAIYFFHISYPADSNINNSFLKLRKKFTANNLNVIDPIEIYEKKFRKISRKATGSDYMKVSKKEQHPSHLANQMFAERLYDEIISNPKYLFSE